MCSHQLPGFILTVCIRVGRADGSGAFPNQRNRAA
jgi:hypothetical protein